MRITLTSAHIRAIVTGFNRILPRKSSVPILDFLLIEKCGEADAGITGSDPGETLQFTATGCAESAGTGPDLFLMPFSALRKLKLRKNDSVVLEPGIDGDSPIVRMTVVTGGQEIRSEIPSEPTEGYPFTLDRVPVSEYRVEGFLDAYRRALTFASTDPTRQVLNGVFRHEAEQALVGTDGRRLGLFHVPDLPIEGDFILPPSNLFSGTVLPGGPGEIGLHDDGMRQVFEIRSGSWRYQVRCTEGVYPNYRQVIPDEGATDAGVIVFSDSDLSTLEEAVTHFETDADHRIIVAGNEDRVMVMGPKALEDGSLPYVILPDSTCESRTGEPIVQAVSGKFLLDGLRAGLNVCRMPPDTSPWRCTGNIDGLHVVMPLRMDDADRQSVSEFFKSITATRKGAQNVKDGAAGNTADTRDQEQNPAGEPNRHEPNLTLVRTDPVQELMDSVAEAHEAVKQAASALRGIKGKVRAAEKHYRAREKEFTSTRKIIESLKEAANF